MAAIRLRGPTQWEVRVRRKRQPVQCRTFDTKETADDFEDCRRDVFEAVLNEATSPSAALMGCRCSVLP